MQVQPATTFARIAPTHAMVTVNYVDEVVHLSPFARRAISWAIVFFTLANSAVLALFALVYWKSETTDSLLWFMRNYFLFFAANAFLHSYSRSIASGYALLSVLFAITAIRTVVRSLTRRCRSRTQAIDPTNTYQGPSSSRTNRLVDLIQAFRYLRRSIGVQGPYFDLRLLVEEWFELATQTVAAHSASKSVSNAPLNVTFGFVIFLNGIASVAHTRVFRHSLVKQRLASVLADLVLDFVWGTLLPIWMYAPIVRLYSIRGRILDEIGDFPAYTREVERVLVLTWKSYAISLIPFCTSLIKLVDLQSLIRELSPRERVVRGKLIKLDPHVAIGRQRPNLFMRIAHILLPVYALFILATTLAANGIFRSVPPIANVPCIRRVHPWFTTKEACMTRRIDCMVLGVQGIAPEVSEVLEQVDDFSVADIQFINCRRLEIPRNIRRLRYLTTITVQNSTISKWDSDAAVSDANFRELRWIRLHTVQFLNPPAGLIGFGRPIAASMEWIRLENLNGPWLLSQVGTNWRGLQELDCIQCNLKEVPSIVFDMPRLTILVLALNDLQFVSHEREASSNLRLQQLWLDGNPGVTILPDALWRQAATCEIFSVTWTNLSIVPDWVADVAGPSFVITATGTPICQGITGVSPRIFAHTVCDQSFKR